MLSADNPRVGVKILLVDDLGRVLTITARNAIQAHKRLHLQTASNGAG